MYSKHFDSKEFLLQIMILFEAETEQLLKIYINKQIQQETIRTNSSSQVTTPSLFDLHEIYKISIYLGA